MHSSGMLGTPREEHHRDDLWNYFYRGILAFEFAAKAFGNEPLFQKTIKYCDQFEKKSGTNYGSSVNDKT